MLCFNCFVSSDLSKLSDRVSLKLCLKGLKGLKGQQVTKYYQPLPWTPVERTDLVQIRRPMSHLILTQSLGVFSGCDLVSHTSDYLPNRTNCALSNIKQMLDSFGGETNLATMIFMFTCLEKQEQNLGRHSEENHHNKQHLHYECIKTNTTVSTCCGMHHLGNKEKNYLEPYSLCQL